MLTIIQQQLQGGDNMEWICNKCGGPTEIVDVETFYLEFEGMQEGFVCENCKEWWISSETAKKMVKGEEDCEAKME